MLTRGLGHCNGFFSWLWHWDCFLRNGESVYSVNREESMDAWLHKEGTVPLEVHSPPYHYHNTDNFQYPLQTELGNEMWVCFSVRHLENPCYSYLVKMIWTSVTKLDQHWLWMEIRTEIMMNSRSVIIPRAAFIILGLLSLDLFYIKNKIIA